MKFDNFTNGKSCLDPVKVNRDYRLVLDTLALAYEANAGVKLQKKYVPFEQLIKKIIFHGYTLLQISIFDEVKLSNGASFKIHDFSSANIILRAIIESCAILHWLCFEPIQEEEIIERITLWQLQDIYTRLKLSEKKDWGIHQFRFKADKRRCFQLLYSLFMNKVFANRCDDQIVTILKSVLDNNKIPTIIKPPMHELIDRAKFGNSIKLYYKFLCSHAHSGFISASQVHTWVSEFQKSDKVTVTIAIATLIFSITARSMITHFSQVRAFFKNNKEKIKPIIYYSRFANKF